MATDEDGSPFEPTELHIEDKQARVRIAWADGHNESLPYAYLRGFCPCAVCQGHGGDLAFVVPPDDLLLTDFNEVGHYAVNFVWQDGHRTGIYSLEYLRSLCPCSECQKRMGRAHVAHRLDPAWQQQFGLAASPAQS